MDDSSGKRTWLRVHVTDAEAELIAELKAKLSERVHRALPGEQQITNQKLLKFALLRLAQRDLRLPYRLTKDGEIVRKDTSAKQSIDGPTRQR